MSYKKLNNRRPRPGVAQALRDHEDEIAAVQAEYYEMLRDMNGDDRDEFPMGPVPKPGESLHDLAY